MYNGWNILRGLQNPHIGSLACGVRACRVEKPKCKLENNCYLPPKIIIRNHSVFPVDSRGYCTLRDLQHTGVVLSIEFPFELFVGLDLIPLRSVPANNRAISENDSGLPQIEPEVRPN